VPCTTYIGENGAGHYVKMVHNGIEYGDMQMICEAYALMQGLLGLKPRRWAPSSPSGTPGIARQLPHRDHRRHPQAEGSGHEEKGLRRHRPRHRRPEGHRQVDLDQRPRHGRARPTIAEAVFARCISAIKEERVAASKILKGPGRNTAARRRRSSQAIHDALYCSKICSYAQGFQLMRTAQKEYNWKLNFGEIAQIWRGGCIIRAAFLQKITEAYARNPDLANLLLDPYFNKTVKKAQANWRKVVALAAECGVPAPTFSSALAYYDSYRSARLPANLLQAQRDYFGAHTYERTDQPRGKFFHIDWPEPKRPQDHKLSVLMVILGGLMPCVIGFFNVLNDVAALLLARGEPFLSPFGKPQQAALATLFLRIHDHGSLINEIFAGLWLFPFGILVFRSMFLPRLLGIGLIINGLAYLIISLTGILAPIYVDRVTRIVSPAFVGEGAIMLWLMIKGARPQPPNATVPPQ
jgi:uncharacterized membrane protein YuzA (DUF378 family)